MSNPILINQFGVNSDLINNVFNEDNIPRSSSFILILSDGFLPDGALGCCLPRELMEFNSYINVFAHYLEEEWDFVIFLSRSICEYSNTHPAYFTFILAHEIGHAHIYVKDNKNHIHCSIIQSFIGQASSNKIKYFELPHEQLCDMFGISIAKRLFSKQQFEEEVQALKNGQAPQTIERLQRILSLPNFEDFNHLRESMIDILSPYKVELISIINECKKVTTKKTLLDLVDDVEKIFE